MEILVKDSKDEIQRSDQPKSTAKPGVLGRVSQEERERHWAAERLRAQRDYADALATARAEGRQEGRQEAFNEGFEIGLLIGIIHVLQEWLGLPETPTAQLSLLPKPDLVQMQETLWRQFQDQKPIIGTPPTGKV
jgi:flagellar biosynthesis/type III secretory pathway protein FliH